MDVLFIKQGVTSYGHIESAIRRAARDLPGLSLKTIDLTRIFFSQPESLRNQGKPVSMPPAISGLLQQVLEDKSPVIFLLNGFVLQWYVPAFFRAIKQQGRTIVSWQIDDPYYIDKNTGMIEDVDILLSVDSSTVSVYQAAGKRAAYLPLACDPELHKRYDDGDESYRSDICFVGAPFKGSRRVRLIDEIAPYLAKHRSRIIGASELDTWKENLVHYSELQHVIHDAIVKIDETVRFFSGAKINLNIHKDSYGHRWDKNARKIDARSPCERTFAIAGCGGFQLVDETRSDLAGEFEIGKEVITFSDARDLVEKMAYFLEHDEERNRIALAAQRRAYAEHSYKHRLGTIVDLL